MDRRPNRHSLRFAVACLLGAVVQRSMQPLQPLQLAIEACRAFLSLSLLEFLWRAPTLEQTMSSSHQCLAAVASRARRGDQMAFRLNRYRYRYPLCSSLYSYWNLSMMIGGFARRRPGGRSGGSVCLHSPATVTVTVTATASGPPEMSVRGQIDGEDSASAATRAATLLTRAPDRDHEQDSLRARPPSTWPWQPPSPAG